MDTTNQALHTVAVWLGLVIGLLAGVFNVIETVARGLLLQAGVPPGLQQIVLLAIALLLIVAILRIFGGLIRLLLIVFLILLILHVAVPAIGH